MEEAQRKSFRELRAHMCDLLGNYKISILNWGSMEMSINLQKTILTVFPSSCAQLFEARWRLPGSWITTFSFPNVRLGCWLVRAFHQISFSFTFSSQVLPFWSFYSITLSSRWWRHFHWWPNWCGWHTCVVYWNIFPSHLFIANSRLSVWLCGPTRRPRGSESEKKK